MQTMLQSCRVCFVNFIPLDLGECILEVLRTDKRSISDENIILEIDSVSVFVGHWDSGFVICGNSTASSHRLRQTIKFGGNHAATSRPPRVGIDAAKSTMTQ